MGNRLERLENAMMDGFATMSDQCERELGKEAGEYAEIWKTLGGESWRDYKTRTRRLRRDLTAMDMRWTRI